jgi:hypothetical protein
MEDLANHNAISPSRFGVEVRKQLDAATLVFRGQAPGKDAKRDAVAPTSFSHDGVHRLIQTGHVHTKTRILEMCRKDRADKFWKLNFGLRPAEELYELTADPHAALNLAAEAAHKDTLTKLRERMEAGLKSQNDPRMAGNGGIFDEYRVTREGGFYEKFMRGEKEIPGWVLPTDFEKEPIKQP